MSQRSRALRPNRVSASSRNSPVSHVSHENSTHRTHVLTHQAVLICREGCQYRISRVLDRVECPTHRSFHLDFYINCYWFMQYHYSRISSYGSLLAPWAMRAAKRIYNRQYSRTHASPASSPDTQKDGVLDKLKLRAALPSGVAASQKRYGYSLFVVTSRKQLPGLAWTRHSHCLLPSIPCEFGVARGWK